MPFENKFDVSEMQRERGTIGDTLSELRGDGEATQNVYPMPVFQPAKTVLDVAIEQNDKAAVDMNALRNQAHQMGVTLQSLIEKPIIEESLKGSVFQRKLAAAKAAFEKEQARFLAMESAAEAAEHEWQTLRENLANLRRQLGEAQARFNGWKASLDDVNAGLLESLGLSDAEPKIKPSVFEIMACERLVAIYPQYEKRIAQRITDAETALRQFEKQNGLKPI